MTGRDHDRYRDMTAAYVLGALQPHERAEIEAHLGTCDHCRQDVVSFAPLPALLARVDHDETTMPDAPTRNADHLVTAVRADVDRLRASRRRWRLVAGAAAVVAVVVGFLVVGDDEPSTRPPDIVALEVVSASSGTTAEVLADERAWGTYVHVSVEDLPDREAYAMWVVDDDGTWEAAGSWGPTPDGSAALGASSQRRLAEIDRIVVTSMDRADQLLVARA